jgi:ABC-2 type transporter
VTTVPLTTNGVGKTTTVECAEGLRRPDGGTVRLFGIDPYQDRSAARRLVGVQLQESELPVVGYAGFGVALPKQPAGFLLALLLTAAAMLTLGLGVSSLARTGRVAAAAGSMLFLPLMFFAGLWLPQALMPAALRRASDDTPLGAAVAALQRTMSGQWPSAGGLAILAGYALVFGAVAWRFFRWE